MKKKIFPKHLHADYLRTRKGRPIAWAGPETMAEELLLNSPEELEDAVARFNSSRENPQTDPGITVIEFILRSLEEEAKAILAQDHREDVQAKSAKDVLTRSIEVRNTIKKRTAEDTALRMMYLTASAIRMTIHDHALHGKYETAKQTVRGIDQGEARTAARQPEWTKWQEEADKIWKEHSAWAIERVAKKIQKKFPTETVRTIRFRIKKTSP